MIPKSLPWGRFMIPTLNPEMMSPISHSLNGYRGNQRRMGMNLKSKDLATEHEHLERR